MKRTQILIMKRAYLGLSILEISKVVMYESWHDYVKSKYREKAKLCYIDTGNFIVYKKTEDIYKDIETRFDTSNYKLEKLLPKAKNKKVIESIKDELGGRLMAELIT